MAPGESLAEARLGAQLGVSRASIRQAKFQLMNEGLLEFDDRAANFVRDTTYYMLAYAGYVTPEIAHSIVDVDNANRWGLSARSCWDWCFRRCSACRRFSGR